MSDRESIKKMLRSVLQSSKSGVSINCLQAEYRSLCGENIPLKKLGFSNLEDYLQSIPSVVRLEQRMGELKCFAAVCQETAHIAELVAKQKSPKKSGRSQVINCRMRFKPSNSYMLNVRPRSSLRQPSASGASTWSANRSRSHGGHRGFSASGDYRNQDQRFSSITPIERRQPPGPQPVKECLIPDRLNGHPDCYDPELEQRRISQLLEKYSSGLWMSKVSEVYCQMFSQKIHPQILLDMEKWTQICMVEQLSSYNRADRLIYPPLLSKPTPPPRKTSTNICPKSPTESSTISPPFSSQPSTPKKPSSPVYPVPKARVSLQKPLDKTPTAFPPQPVAMPRSKQETSVNLGRPAHNPALAARLPPCVSPEDHGRSDCKNGNLSTTTGNQSQSTHPLAPTWTYPAKASTPVSAPSVRPSSDILPFMNVTLPATADSSSPQSSQTSGLTEVRQRLKELLSKYTHGLWVHALPKLFIDTYKSSIPNHLLENLTPLLDICTVEYPNPHDKKKAILYNSSRVNMEATEVQDTKRCRNHSLPSSVEMVGPVVPPPLVLPSEQFPSVLVTDAVSSNAVTIRYVGDDYSNAQEAMEDAMRSFYILNSTHHHLSKPVIGQLVAARGEEENDLARAQITEVTTPDMVKIYYVDYGLAVEMPTANLMHLHQNFLSLPFQAANVKLAGLEAFSSHPLVLSSLDKLAVGKILLMETLEPCQQNEMPDVVLYDTSQDDDVNINSLCLRALQDETMNNPLTVNRTYQDVCVTNVSADGIVYCQLPCRGTARLDKLLEETEAFFISQMTSESLVSRPFNGKFCLARCKGKWSRVEITNLHGNRVIEVLFMDLGVPATVEVTELREIPPLLIKDFTVIPPQAIRCRLADLTVPEGDWSPEAVLWVKETVLASHDCKMKIAKLDKHKGDRLVHMYLFIETDSQDLDKSINHQLAHSQLWQKLSAQDNHIITNNNRSLETGISAPTERVAVTSPVMKDSSQTHQRANGSDTTSTSVMPPLMELPLPGQNMDVFVPVACHPGYFVLQPWQDLHKLVVLMGEMMLYYNQTLRTTTATHIQKGHVFAAKIDKSWHRVLVKGTLTNGLVSVYQLDYGKHELVRSSVLQPLIEEFRQLPFQAITAQLAGVAQQQWSEEASVLFRNNVEGQALVAQVESVQEVSEVKGELGERRLTVFLVDTRSEDRDLWIHSIMADIVTELSFAARNDLLRNPPADGL
ncbi:tudor domain-containing protein 7A [Aulostomus maculatus]